MTRTPRHGPVPSDAEDPAAVRRDDLLLDVLGRGGQPADDDPALALLYEWRADVARGDGAEPGARPAAGAAQAPRLNGSRHGRAVSDLQPRRPVPSHPRREPRRRRYTRRAFQLLSAALVTAAGLGGVTVAAADAGPGSPLWPVTRAVYGERASSRQATIDAERAIQRARDAAQHGRPAEARRHLDEAEREAERVRQPQEAERLRDEADKIREKLPDGEPGGKPSPPPGHDQPSPSPSPRESPSSGEPSESPSEGISESDKDDEDNRERDRSSRGRDGRGDPPPGNERD